MVEWKKLGEVCEVLDSQRKPVAKGNRTFGEYPYYGANGIQDYVDDYIFDGTFLLMGEDGSVINKDNSPVLHWAVGKIWVNNHAHILKGCDKALLRYLYYCLQCTDVSDIVRGIPPKINQANMRNILLPNPPLPEQQRIVDILDTFTSSIDNLKQQIAERRKQYEHYREKLLDLEGKKGVEMMALGEICEIKTGKGITQKDCSDEGKYPVISGGQAPMGMFHQYNRETNTVTISRVGAYAGFVSYIEVRFYLNDKCFSVIPLIEHSFENKYLFCVLKGKEKQIMKLQSEGGVPTINTQKLSNILIPVPSLAEQQRIVSILDTFEESIRNLEEQLKLREKQYEYYRNKLLTFE